MYDDKTLTVRPSYLDLFQRVTEPVQLPEASYERRRAQSFTIFVVALIGVHIAAAVCAEVLFQARTVTAIVGAATVTTALTYLMIRVINYRVALIFFTIMTFFWTGLLIGLHPAPLVSVVSLLPIFVVSLFWTTRLTIAATVASVLFIAVIVGVEPGVDYADLGFVLLFVTGSSVMVIISNFILRTYQEQVDAQAEQIARSTARFRTAVEGSLDAFMLLRGTHNPDGKLVDFEITAVNAEAERQLARSRYDLIGMAASKLLPEAKRQLRFEKYRYVLENDSPVSEEYQSQDDDGNPLWFHMQIVPAQDGIAVTIRDITRRKLNEAQKMTISLERQRTELLQRVISEVSHDIRTPLTVIKMSAHLLSTRKLEPEREAAYREQLHQQVDRLDKMVADLVNVAQLEEASDTYHFRKVDVNDALRNLVADYQAIATNNKQTLRFEPATNLPRVMLDTSRMREALDNLIDNAIRYTPAGGFITLRTGRHADKVKIEVEDTGKGIEPHALPRIFEHFYREDEHRPGDGSTGLGLSVAQRIVNEHEGIIDVQSRPGEGSIFRILLPTALDTSHITQSTKVAELREAAHRAKTRSKQDEAG